MDDDFFLHLTDVGREVAEQTYEKHCFFTRLLIDAGVDPEMAEQDACRMEHTISENSFQQLKAATVKFEKSKGQATQRTPAKEFALICWRKDNLERV